MEFSDIQLSDVTNLLQNLNEDTVTQFDELLEKPFNEIKDMRIDGRTMIVMRATIDRIERELNVDCSDYYEIPYSYNRLKSVHERRLRREVNSEELLRIMSDPRNQAEENDIRLNQILNFMNGWNPRKFRKFFESVQGGGKMFNYLNYLRSVSSVCSNLIDDNLDDGVLSLLLMVPVANFFSQELSTEKKFWKTVWGFCGKRPIPDVLSLFVRTHEDSEVFTFPSEVQFRCPVSVSVLVLVIMLENVHKKKTKDFVQRCLRENFKLEGHMDHDANVELETTLNQDYKSEMNMYNLTVRELAKYRAQLSNGYAESYRELESYTGQEKKDRIKCVEAVFAQGFQQLVKSEMAMRMLGKLFKMADVIVLPAPNRQHTQQRNQAQNFGNQRTLQPLGDLPQPGGENVMSYEEWERTFAPNIDNQHSNQGMNYSQPWNQNQASSVGQSGSHETRAHQQRSMNQVQSAGNVAQNWNWNLEHQQEFHQVPAQPQNQFHFGDQNHSFLANDFDANPGFHNQQQPPEMNHTHDNNNNQFLRQPVNQQQPQNMWEAQAGSNGMANPDAQYQQPAFNQSNMNQSYTAAPQDSLPSTSQQFQNGPARDGNQYWQHNHNQQNGSSSSHGNNASNQYDPDQPNFAAPQDSFPSTSQELQNGPARDGNQFWQHNYNPQDGSSTSNGNNALNQYDPEQPNFVSPQDSLPSTSQHQIDPASGDDTSQNQDQEDRSST